MASTKKPKPAEAATPAPMPNFGTARYLYKMGFVVTDDVIQNAAKNGVLPFEGALIVRLKKPLPCVFISFGLGGISLPDTGLCAIGDAWNVVTKEEKFATGVLMEALDFEHKLGLRMQWYLIDIKETDARVIRSPSDMELTKLFKTPSAMKTDDLTKYKLAARIVRRRTTAGASMPDGHESDSDKDPMMVYLEEMMEKEERSEKARKKRLGPFPDTPLGWKISKFYHGSGAKRIHDGDSCEERDGEAKKQPQKNQKFKTRTKQFYPQRLSQKRKRTSYNVDPADIPGTADPNDLTAAPPVSSKRAEWNRNFQLGVKAKGMFGDASESEGQEGEATVTEETAPSQPVSGYAQSLMRVQQPAQNICPGVPQPEHSYCEPEDQLQLEIPLRSDDDEIVRDLDEDEREMDYEDG